MASGLDRAFEEKLQKMLDEHMADNGPCDCHCHTLMLDDTNFAHAIPCCSPAEAKPLPKKAQSH